MLSSRLGTSELTRKSEKRAGPVVDDHRIVLFSGKDFFHNEVKLQRINLVAIHDLDAHHVESLVSRERGIDGIGVNADRIRASRSDDVLSQHRGAETFTHAALALEKEVNVRHYDLNVKSVLYW